MILKLLLFSWYCFATFNAYFILDNNFTDEDAKYLAAGIEVRQLLLSKTYTSTSINCLLQFKWAVVLKWDNMGTCLL